MNLSQYFRMLLAWIERAIAILEMAIIPAPPNGKDRVGQLVSYLSKPASTATLPPRSARSLRQNLKAQFAAGSDAVFQMMTKIQPELEDTFYTAYRNLAYQPAIVEEPQNPEVLGLRAMAADAAPDTNAAPAPAAPVVYALRVKASLFGSNAPRLPVVNGDGTLQDYTTWPKWEMDEDEETNLLFLDAAYEEIQTKSYVVIRNQRGSNIVLEGPDAQSYIIDGTAIESRAAYGVPGKTTKLTLSTPWRNDPAEGDEWEDVLRGTVVYAQSEELPLAFEPIPDLIPEPDTRNTILLAELYDGLEAGRWLIISGERDDIPDVTGVRATELVMLAAVEQVDATGFGDKTHSKLILANDLKYRYKRGTVTIYANVVKATQGETRNEVLGSGDSSQALQSFTLRQAPLTYVAASNPKGVESTLHVRVNDVEWHEVESLAELGPTDLDFVTRTSDDDKTTITFGNGQQGARLPTGFENIRAVYRSGIGKGGNVKAGQISQLMTRPLGVKEVTNPLRASGGADKESRDQARKNTPLAVLALDRLVSTRDYADFTRKFAGIGKASAARFSNGNHQVVHVTIAGADDIPIDRTSDLYRSLFKALHDFGDPYLPIQLQMRELMLILISANVRILPDYLWESVATKIRIQLLETFSFERRELGQDVLLSEVISAIQSVEGVSYVDVDLLGGVSEKNDTGALRTPQEISDMIQNMLEEQKDKPKSRIPVNLATKNHPAQLAFLTPYVEATLILNEVK
jgi:predicted phage baseplate assembly protein